MKVSGLLLLVLLACSLRPALAEPLVYRGEQTLWTDTVWDGEVLVDGILTVAPGVTLEIRPGSTVSFTRYDSNGDGIGEHELFSQGVIRAIGSAERPIRFTSAEVNPQRGDWGAVNMMTAEADNRLEHCRVEYGYRGFHAHFSSAVLRDCTFRENQRGAQFQESRVVMERCRLQDNGNGLQFRDSEVDLVDSAIISNHWGVRCVYSTLRMRNCQVEGNLVNGVNVRAGTATLTGNRIIGNRRGLYLQECQAVIVGNDLLANSEHGIFLENGNVRIAGNRVAGNGRSGVRWVNAAGELTGNDLAGNGEYALINDGSAAVDARGNWWGHASPHDIAAVVRDGTDRAGMGPVDAGTPLDQPVPRGPSAPPALP